MGSINRANTGYESPSSRVNAALALTEQIGNATMDIVDGKRSSYAIFLERKFNPQPLNMTFAVDNALRTGALIVDEIPFIEKPLLARSSYAKFLGRKLNPQPPKITFEADEALRTGATLH